MMIMMEIGHGIGSSDTSEIVSVIDREKNVPRCPIIGWLGIIWLR